MEAGAAEAEAVRRGGDADGARHRNSSNGGAGGGGSSGSRHSRAAPPLRIHYLSLRLLR
jgi:hypothetical protein